jgi:type I restriction enzyme S subunit
MNVPKLRFKEFTDEWKTHKLKDFFSKITKKNKSNSIHNVISNSAKFGLVKQIDYFSKDIANTDNTESYFIIEKNDFVYNPRKSLEAPFGPICKYNYNETGIVSPLYLCFRCSQLINHDFFEYLFKSSVWYKYIYQNGDSGARHDRVNIKDSTFFLMPIFVPQSKEQEKIAKFLTTVDKKITNLENTITSLENQKKGLLQQIFSQKLRFKDKNGNNYPNWEKKKLGDITQSQGGTALEKYTTTNGLYKFISIGNYSTYSTYLDNGIRIDLNNKTKKQLLNKNDLVMILNDKTSSGNIIGRTLLIDKDNTYIYNQRSQRLICNTKIIIPSFLYFLLNSDRKNIIKKVQGATQIYINYSTIEVMHLNIPCLEEQTKIADFLSAFDRKLDNQKAQLEHWKQIKKGLLQQMFV